MNTPKKHITKAHDHFFRMVMSDNRVAREFFEKHLPEDLRKAADLNCLELQSGTYIDEMWQESIADMLFKTVIEGHEAYLYLVVDHQSRPDALMPFRVLKYICNIIDQYLKEQKSKTIPLILPFIVYHGRQRWLFSTDLRDLVDAPKTLVDTYFLKPFILIDLNCIEDAAIKEHVWLSVVELTMKHIFARDILPYLYDIFTGFEKLGKYDYQSLAETVLTYILDRGQMSDNEKFLELVKAKFSKEVGEKIMTLAEQLKAEGIKQGFEQGIEQGIEQGFEKGIEKGIEKGFESGVIKVALGLLQQGLDKEVIAKATGLNKDEINSLLKSTNH